MAALTEEDAGGAGGAAVSGTSMLERHGANAVVSSARSRAKDYYALVREHAGVDLTTAKDAELRDALKRHNAAPADVEQLSGPKLVDEVFKTCVEPKLVQPTFVFDYPLALSPLAKPKRGIRTRWSAGSCSCSIASWRTRSASSTTR